MLKSIRLLCFNVFIFLFAYFFLLSNTNNGLVLCSYSHFQLKSYFDVCMLKSILFLIGKMRFFVFLRHSNHQINAATHKSYDWHFEFTLDIIDFAIEFRLGRTKHAQSAHTQTMAMIHNSPISLIHTQS